MRWLRSLDPRLDIRFLRRIIDDLEQARIAKCTQIAGKIDHAHVVGRLQHKDDAQPTTLQGHFELDLTELMGLLQRRHTPLHFLCGEGLASLLQNQAA